MDEQQRQEAFSGSPAAGEVQPETEVETPNTEEQAPEAGESAQEPITTEQPHKEKTEQFYQTKYQDLLANLNRADPTGQLTDVARGAALQAEQRFTEDTEEDYLTTRKAEELFSNVLQSHQQQQQFSTDWNRADAAIREMGNLDNNIVQQVDQELDRHGVVRPNQNGGGTYPTNYAVAFIETYNRINQQAYAGTQQATVQQQAAGKVEAANQVAQPTATGVTPAPEMSDAMKSIQQMKEAGSDSERDRFLRGSSE